AIPSMRLGVLRFLCRGPHRQTNDFALHARVGGIRDDPRPELAIAHRIGTASTARILEAARGSGATKKDTPSPTLRSCWLRVPLMWQKMSAPPSSLMNPYPRSAFHLETVPVSLMSLLIKLPCYVVKGGRLEDGMASRPQMKRAGTCERASW